MKSIDVVILTDNRYVNPLERDAYIDNVLLEDQLVQEALEKEGFTTEDMETGLTIFGPVGCKSCNDGYKVWRCNVAKNIAMTCNAM